MIYLTLIAGAAVLCGLAWRYLCEFNAKDEAER